MPKSVAKVVLALGLMVLLPGLAGAQVVYAPVQYQYTYTYPNGREFTFYYGGNDPQVFEHAYRYGCLSSGTYGVHEGQYGAGYIHPGLIGRPPFTVYSDCAPLQNAAVYGFSPADARNEAYARVPRYFTKADTLAAAVPAVDPSYYQKSTSPAGLSYDAGRVWVVPAQGWPAPGAVPNIDIRPARRGAAPTTRPSTGPATTPAMEPKPLMVIPKRLLEPKKADGSSVAAAR